MVQVPTANRMNLVAYLLYYKGKGGDEKSRN